MYRSRKAQQLIFVCLLMVITALAACSPGFSGGGENDAGEVAVCDLSKDLLGWRLSTTGEITFIDLSPRDGVYFELQEGGCESGAFAHNEFWDTFSAEQQGKIAHGSTVHIEGILTTDQGRWIVSVQKILP